MREALFIKRNAKKWQEYQHFETDDPDEKADRFINLVDDLAYAKTFYPGRHVHCVSIDICFVKNNIAHMQSDPEWHRIPLLQ